MENLGGPAETSHLKTPLVELLTLLRMMCVGELRSSTEMPDNRKMVKGGESERNVITRTQRDSAYLGE